MKRNLSSKLPSFFKINPLFQRLSKNICASKVMSSLLLYSKGNQDFLFFKDGTMHAPLDWQLFSIMRASSKTLVSSGPIIRAEKGIYMKRQSYGDVHVDQLYRTLLGEQTQNLMVLSRKMKRQDLQPEVNSEIYKLIDCPVVDSKAKFIEQLSLFQQGPILVELGLNFLQAYYEQVLSGAKNSIDLMMISRFEGQLESQFIGTQFHLPLKQLYKKSWESEKYPCTLPNNIKGSLTFETYTLQYSLL